MSRIQGHTQWFGSPEAYAEGIQTKQSAGEQFDDPVAAAVFQLQHPEFFRDSATTPQDMIAEGSQIAAPPESQFNLENVNQILNEYGVRPMTAEEQQSYVDAMVERQALGRRQAVERQLERFEANFPHEFERAKKQIHDAAAEMAADRQEEFAARGMYYSSIMAGALTKIDDKTMDIIGEIARDAANYVSELHRDLQDIEEWAAVEREVMRHQVRIEERDLGFNLAKVHFTVLEHADRFALDTWAQSEQMKLQERGIQIEEMLAELQRAEVEGNWAAMAQQASSPIMRDYLNSIGMSLDQFQRLPISEQAAIMRTGTEMLEWQNKYEEGQLRNRTLAVDVAIAETYGMAQAYEQYRQMGFQTEMMEMEVQDFRNLLRAKGNLNYYDRILSTEIQQASANLGYTRAQTEALQAATALKLAETTRLEGGEDLQERTEGYIMEALSQAAHQGNYLVARTYLEYASALANDIEGQAGVRLRGKVRNAREALEGSPSYQAWLEQQDEENVTQQAHWAIRFVRETADRIEQAPLTQGLITGSRRMIEGELSSVSDALRSIFDTFRDPVRPHRVDTEWRDVPQ